MQFPQFSEQGTWKLSVVWTCDAASNCRSLDTAALAAMGIPTQLTVGKLRYQFSGFLPPISNDGLNSAKAGQTIAAKWQLKRSGGEVVTELSAITGVVVLQIACANGEPVDSTIPADTSGESGLRFDETADQFVFTWHSAKSWSGTCRRLQVSLNDGTTHSADFTFK